MKKRGAVIFIGVGIVIIMAVVIIATLSKSELENRELSEQDDAIVVGADAQEPFTYTMTSDDPFYQIVEVGQSEISFSPIRRLLSNKEISMHFAFNKNVDVESVEHKFADIFAEHTWSLTRLSDKEVELTVLLHGSFEPSYLIIDLSGINDEKGQRLVDDEPLHLSHSLGFTYGTIDPDTLETTELFRLPQSFYRFIPSDDGKLALAQVSVASDAGPSLYIVLDLEQAGDIIEIFPLYFIEKPHWVRDRHAFYYTSSENGVSAIKMYDLETQESSIIWTSPYSEENHDGLRWATLHTLPGTDQIYIIDMRSITSDDGFFYTADLYVMTDYTDSSPFIMTDFMGGQCDGMVCDPQFQVVASDAIFYMHYDQQLIDTGEREYYLHNIVEQKRVKVHLDEQDRYPESVLALDHERVLVVTERMDDNRSFYSFTLHYPWEDRREFQFAVNDWSGYARYGQIAPLGNDRYFLGESYRGAIADFEKRELTRVDYAPLYQTAEALFWLRSYE